MVECWVVGMPAVLPETHLAVLFDCFAPSGLVSQTLSFLQIDEPLEKTYCRPIWYSVPYKMWNMVILSKTESLNNH